MAHNYTIDGAILKTSGYKNEALSAFTVEDLPAKSYIIYAITTVNNVTDNVSALAAVKERIRDGSRWNSYLDNNTA
jgi:hypothetical protein